MLFALQQRITAPTPSPARDQPTFLQTKLPPENALAEGDLIFRRGRDAIADAVMVLGGGVRFSHVGVILRRGDALVVIHALPSVGDALGGVIEEPLSAFVALDVAADVGVYRLSSLDSERALAFRAYLQSQIGKPFDLKLQYSDENSHYCTELVMRGLEASGLSIAKSLDSVQFLSMPEPAFAPEALLSIPGLKPIPSLHQVRLEPQ